MSDDRQQRLQDLTQFLRTIQKPNRPIEHIGVDESMVASGLIDSLAIVQIVLYLENTYGVDFSTYGFDPERLASMTSILD
ncbi:MAG TPA: acyl carrier protein, partial [Methylophilaceae bacterium]|nr:acyl carrier protein [Methylophilaceae bacterium]